MNNNYTNNVQKGLTADLKYGRGSTLTIPKKLHPSEAAHPSGRASAFGPAGLDGRWDAEVN